MRMLVQAKIPHKTFNKTVKEGTTGKIIGRILDELKPETVYFTNYDGLRSAIMIIDVPQPSDVPRIAEPWFLAFDADVQFHIVMGPGDLGKAGLEELGKKWA